MEATAKYTERTGLVFTLMIGNLPEKTFAVVEFMLPESVVLPTSVKDAGMD